MTLTFHKIKDAPGQHRADGEELSYVISKLPRGWLLTVYSQQVVEFKSDNTTLVMLKDPVERHPDDKLGDLKVIAEAFETSKLVNPWDYTRRLGDAISRSYKELGYIR